MSMNFEEKRMRIIQSFAAFISILLLSTTKVAVSEQDNIVCPDCEQLELRNAGTNESDICHDYFQYVCLDTAILPVVSKNFSTHLEKIFVSPSNFSTSVLPTQNVTTMIGSEVRLTCPHPPAVNINYQWKRNGILISKILDLKSRSHLSDNGSLYIHHIHFEDSGNYSCEIFKGLHFIQISSVNLSVEYPAMVTSSPKVQFLISGKPSVLNCFVNANPTVKFVIWIKDKRLFDKDTSGVSSLLNGSLLFENPSLEHEGEYKCTPYNIHGTYGSSKLMKIIVKEKVDAFAAYDAKIDESHNETIKQNVENLFVHRKQYKSRVMKLAKTRSKSSIELRQANETNADIKMINHTIISLFSKQRNALFDLPHKESIRRSVIHVFQSYSLNTEIQKFDCITFRKGKLINLNAKNLIGILPSPNFDKPGDRIFVIGAHYDTVYENPGIDDNGSGSAYVLEVSRLLSRQKNTLNASIYFVLFDQEESGLEGSIAFVNEYLIPKVIDKKRAVFVGAYLADMLLLYDDKEDVQTLPRDIQRMCPDAYNWITNNSFRGDFVSVWARNAELFLWNAFKESWNELPNNPFKVLLINSPLAANYNDTKLAERYSTFSRSDHASFWSSAKTHPHIITLPTALLSDMGPWRGYQRMCYHQPCDNEVQLTETNLRFMAHTIDAVVASVRKLVGMQQSNKNLVLN